MNSKKEMTIIGTILGIILILLIGSLVVSLNNTNQDLQQTTITLGSIGPLTGEGAFYGNEVKRGIELALLTLEQQNPTHETKINVIFEDGKCNGKDAVTAAKKLVEFDKVTAIIGGVCSAETLGIAPYTEAQKIITLSPTSSNPQLTTAGDYIFRTWPSDNLQGEEMGTFVANQNLKTVATIAKNSDYNVGLQKAFENAFKAQGGQVLLSETYQDDLKDFRTILTKIKAKNPDAIYIVPNPEDAGSLVTQAKQLDIQAKIFSSGEVQSDLFLEETGELGEGIIFMNPSFNEEQETTKRFVELYTQTFGESPQSAVAAANAYDATMLLAQAVHTNPQIKDTANKEATTQIIKGHLYNVKNYPGAAGTLTIDHNGDAQKGFDFMIIKEGGFEKLE